MGTMLRTALALGAAGVVALPGTAELSNPKVIRGSMGALFRLPAVSATDADTLMASGPGITGAAVWVAAADGPSRSARAASAPRRSSSCRRQ